MEMRGLIFGFLFAMFLGVIGFYAMAQATQGSGQTMDRQFSTSSDISNYLGNISQNNTAAINGLDNAAQTPSSLDPLSFIGTYTGAAYNNFRTLLATVGLMLALTLHIPADLGFLGIPGWLGSFGVVFITLVVIYAFVSFLRGMRAE